MLHRQWLTVRRAGGPRTHQQKQTIRCLRDTVLLLHSLSQKDKLFTVHCVEVLHQYDQVMPGVSMLIRALPDVTDCEGKLAKVSVLASLHVPLPEAHEQVKLLCWTSTCLPLPPEPFLAPWALSSCSGSLSMIGSHLIMSIELA